ncbi:RNA processing protein [Physocladia obscura]|uniref:LSM complex subunit LSM4 n=1 Tax=Physocladia obscura TaxID=109957 RepID=A0AAD5SZI3_9FUNG|nr:RNA processing protein [Physocladia obscura]
MLPLSLLNTAKGHPILVELKTGAHCHPKSPTLCEYIDQRSTVDRVTYNGHLHSCDNWMNINLHEVICTSAGGDKFWRLAEVYIRGSTIKYLRLPDQIIDIVREDREFRERRETLSGNGTGRGGRGGGSGGRGGYNNNRGGRGGGGAPRGRGGFSKQQN